jgi:hypothetical protein
MIYNGGSGLAGLSKPTILDELYHHTKGRGFFVRTLTKAWTVGLFVLLVAYTTICYLRMLFYVLPIWRPRTLDRTTFEEWAADTMPTSLLARWTGMDLAWREYTHTVLLPLFSAVCTAPEKDVLQHPVEEFLGNLFSDLAVLDLIRDFHINNRLYLAYPWHTSLRRVIRRSRRRFPADIPHSEYSSIVHHFINISGPGKPTPCIYSL